MIASMPTRNEAFSMYYLVGDVREEDEDLGGEWRLLGGPRQLPVTEPLVEVGLREGTVLALVREQPLQRRLQDEAVGEVPRLLLVQGVQGPQGDGLERAEWTLC